MIFTEGNKRFSFVVCGYQYPQRTALETEYDSDANWLNCEFRFYENGHEEICVDPCLLTGELSDLIMGLSYVIDGLKKSYSSDFLEPYLGIDIERVENRLKIRIEFEHDSREDGKSWEVTSFLEIEQAKNFLNELKEFQQLYPVR